MDDTFYEDIDYDMDEEELRRRQKQQEDFIIEQYKSEEEMMILIFAQWCINNDLHPEALYERAYPGQMKNKILTDTLEKTVPKEESEMIPYDLVLQALQAFGNDDLAFAVEEAAEQLAKAKEENEHPHINK